MSTLLGWLALAFLLTLVAGCIYSYYCLIVAINYQTTKEEKVRKDLDHLDREIAAMGRKL